MDNLPEELIEYIYFYTPNFASVNKSVNKSVKKAAKKLYISNMLFKIIECKINVKFIGDINTIPFGNTNVYRVVSGDDYDHVYTRIDRKQIVQKADNFVWEKVLIGGMEVGYMVFDSIDSSHIG